MTAGPALATLVLAALGACRGPGDPRAARAGEEAPARPSASALASSAPATVLRRVAPDGALPAADEAARRAAGWLAAVPEADLRFDIAIALGEVARRFDAPEIRRALERARRVADRDADHPQRRLWTRMPPPRSTTAWAAPEAGERRVNPNRVIDEALWCDVGGLRSETLAYIGGAMRDGGGYQTAHALWALVLARDRGCLDAAGFAHRAAPLERELLAAEPDRPDPRDGRATDLFAERLLVLCLARSRTPRLPALERRLLAAQNADGSFGAPVPDARYLQHATAVAAWALAACP